MLFPASLITWYLRQPALGRGSCMDDPMSDLGNFHGDIDDMRRRAQAEGDLDVLRPALIALAYQPRGRLQKLAQYVYPFREEEFASVLLHAVQRIWPDEPLPARGSEIPVEFKDLDIDQWRRFRHAGLGFEDEEEHR